VLDSLVVHLEATDDLLLFVVLRDGRELNDDLRKRISDALRSNLSPRHRPDDIVAVPAIPRTMTGKKLELPVKQIMTGTPVTEVVSRDALVDPSAIEAFAAYAAERAKTA
jgi:acetoacetyl-CoA synthetase